MNPSFTVTFNANGGVGFMVPETHNAPTALTLNAFTRTGYTFTGWNTAKNGSGTPYTNGAIYPFTASVTLYAQWKAPVTPVITWTNPSPILFGTRLGPTQLDAMATVAGNPIAGTYTYSPPAGTLLQPGNNQTLRVTFTPTDTADYTNATAMVSINVVFSAPCITMTKTGPFTVANGQSICVTSRGNLSGTVTVSQGGALWVNGGTITGALSVQAGGVLWVSGATISSLQATGASALTVCGTKVQGSVTVTGSTGSVLIGGTGCAGNTISGSVSITNNTGGVGFSKNSVTGSVTITGNTGGFQYSDNSVHGTTKVTGNS